MNTTPDQPSHQKAKPGRGWFHAGSMLLGFLLGAITISGASTLLQINKSRQTLEVTNKGEKPVQIYHNAAAFWNSGELTIAPSQTMFYSFIDGDTMTVYPESGERTAGGLSS